MNLEIFSPYKILHHRKVLDNIAKDKLIYPISCEIDPSNFCNHSCVWCINGKFRKREKCLLNKNKVLDIVNQLAEVGTKSITFTGGGEPLTHPDIELLLHFVREKGLEVALVTNGGLLNQSKCDAIIKTCKFVRLSIDAGEERTYNRLHRARHNTLQDILTWVKYMRVNSPHDFVIGTAFLVHPYNYREIFTAAQMFREAGSSYLQIRPVFMRGMELTPKILQETQWQVRETLNLQTKSFKIYTILHRFEEIQQIDKNFNECLGHSLLGVVGANGKMYLCCQLRGLDQYCIGDLHRNTLKEIWEGQDRKEVIKRINVNRCPPCRYSIYNTILCYLKGNNDHINFL